MKEIRCRYCGKPSEDHSGVCASCERRYERRPPPVSAINQQPATSPLRRYLVYRSRKSRGYLCVCAARDRRHALRIARQMFTLERTAFAVPEGGGVL